MENQGSYGYPYSGNATLTDTIVVGNMGCRRRASDITGNENVSGSFNVIGTGGSGGLTDGVDANIVGTSLDDLGLAPLGDYGGPTQTSPCSPAAPPWAPARSPTTRGPPLRSPPISGESRSTYPTPTSGPSRARGSRFTPATGSTGQSTAINTAFANPLVVTVAANNEVEPVDGGVVTFMRPPPAPRRRFPLPP